MRLACCVLLTGLIACSSVTPDRKLCGATGQPCCANQVCDADNTCDSSGLCTACGAENQACCAQDACSSTLKCLSRICSLALSCPTMCTLSETRCSAGGGIETCSASGVCPEWTSIVAACPTGTECTPSGTSFDCLERCAGSCAVGTQACSVSGLRACTQGPSDPCPVLTPVVERSEIPTCLAGAIAAPDFSWESPTPQLEGIAALSLNRIDDFLVLDSRGNVIHNAQGLWSYELFGESATQQLALAKCQLPSYAYTAGRKGAVFARRGATWNSESVGESVTLNAIACTNVLGSAAVGQSGKLYVRGETTTGTWQAWPTGFDGPFNGVSLNHSTKQAFLVGPAGAIVRCDGLWSPQVTCVSEKQNDVTADLTAVSVDELSGRVFVVGVGGTVISRGTLATWAPLPFLSNQSTETLNALDLWRPAPNPLPSVVMVGDNGTFWTNVSLGTEGAPVVQDPKVKFTAVAALETGRLIAGDSEGHLWTSAAPSAGAQYPQPTVFGGLQPISESLTDVTSAGAGQVFAIGANGGRYRRFATSWVSDVAGAPLNSPLMAVFAASANEVYGVNHDGTILVRRPSGWLVDSMGIAAGPLNDVAADATSAYAVGAKGAWLEKTRVGGAWGAVTQNATTVTLNKMAVVITASGATKSVVAVGDNCTALIKQGSTFSLLPVPTSCHASRYTSVTTSPSGEVWVGSESGQLFRFANGASEWTTDYLGDGTPIVAIAALDDRAWAVNETGQVFELAGRIWRPYRPSLTSTRVTAVTIDQNPTSVFFAGDTGLIWRVVPSP